MLVVHVTFGGRERESELINETESSTTMLLTELVTLSMLKPVSFPAPFG